ncbi:hypothetical protein Gpo141_00010758 [Globisporangium polare]
MDDACHHTSASDLNQLAAATCDLLISKSRGKRTSSSQDGSSLSLSPFQPELNSLVDLTRQIQELQRQLDAKESPAKGSKPDGAKQSSERKQKLVALHCQRAQSILECVDFDASGLLSASLFSESCLGNTGNDEPEENEHYEEEHDQGATVNGVEKALEDASAAISLAPSSVDGYLIAAQCARALGRTSRAIEFVTQAHQLEPENPEIQQLVKQLAVDAEETPLESLAPPLMTPSHLLSSVFDVPNQEQQQQDDDEPEDQSDGVEDGEIVYQRLLAGHQTLSAIFSASWLQKLEQMMHQNVHHQCATRDEVRNLEKAFSDTSALLRKLLEDSLTTSALGFIHTSVQEMLALAATTTPGGHRLLVENRVLRKWIGQTLAPAVRRFLCSLGRPLSQETGFGDSFSASSRQQAMAVALLRDTLLVFARVLLAMANWRRCTSMAHGLLYSELCADLAKEVGAKEGAYSGLSRFEMMCSDVYARALLVLTPEHNDALQLHQESLQVAITTKDALYELRCHHFVGQAFMRISELDLARVEFTEMLQLSQTLGDSQMETLAQYELGECCVQRGNLPQAQTHFKYAQTLCHQTSNAKGTWRPHSVQQAIAFYAAMKPTRRGAIRIAPSKARNRRGSVFRPDPAQLHHEEPGYASLLSDASNTDAPKLRRPAIWIGPPKLSLEPEHAGKRSLMKTLLGEQTEPVLVQGDDDRSRVSTSAPSAKRASASATAKLFASTTAPSLQQRKPETPRKPRRAGAWRDSVFAIPPSYAELKSLTSSSLQSPVAVAAGCAGGPTAFSGAQRSSSSS